MVVCSKGKTVQDLNDDFSKAVYRENETSLLGTNHFVHCPDFDHKNDQDFVRGGVAIFSDAFIQGDRPPTVFDCHMTYVPGSCMQEEGSSFQIWKQPIKVIELDAAVMIYQFWSKGYYHAMVESLPRLVYVLDYLRLHPETIIISSHPYLYQRRQTINRILGLSPKQRWLSYDKKRTYSVKRLLIPTGTRCGRAQPKCIEELRRAVESTSTIKNLPRSNSANKMILLQKRRSRKILNHNELLQALQAEFPNVREFYGTEPLADTVELHRAADLIIGPHGAGLSNVVFSRRGAGLVELHQEYGRGNSSDKAINTCHQWTAAAAGLSSRMLVQPDGSSFTDFTVNVTEAVDAVRDILKQQSAELRAR